MPSCLSFLRCYLADAYTYACACGIYIFIQSVCAAGVSQAHCNVRSSHRGLRPGKKMRGHVMSQSAGIQKHCNKMTLRVSCVGIPARTQGAVVRHHQRVPSAARGQHHSAPPSPQRTPSHPPASAPACGQCRHAPADHTHHAPRRRANPPPSPRLPPPCSLSRPPQTRPYRPRTARLHLPRC